ncbi:XdhC family protein [Frankia sp. CNm7]|uniref:XdhC family protein n=1 Tax=Frankia nepalensis TaxID=1836974 RepID=A0A937RQ29_9ACTN|nr:XdhC family protein [Frankia nepalensis]MBL7499322.1 XdhC family protein [Frankia nepalensis]MBL7512693.1 XdhC family protein [Frankia nepalensis]MBL7517713.1 XdhC family protein [Frankia nepalensis]MBL7629906.1 XdhC family protein [Frankia nepalensis]
MMSGDGHQPEPGPADTRVPDAVVEGWEVLGRAGELAARGEQFALATVVWRHAPSSGQQGSRAIITADGQLSGWIGGACAEPAVIRAARDVIAEGAPRLLLLGGPEQFGGAIPDGIEVTPIACQSEGALEIYIEPVIPVPSLVVVGRSPMARTLVDLGKALGWRAELVAVEHFTSADVDRRGVVIVATQGHGDEEALATAVAAAPAYVGLVASRRRGASVLGYLAERGVARDLLEAVHVPVGLDLGHTTHREIAVSVLAELVRRRAAGELALPRPEGHPRGRALLPMAGAVEVVDPVCGMTVAAAASGHPFEHAGTTYYFCCAGCRSRFEKDPSAYLPVDAAAGARGAHREA